MVTNTSSDSFYNKIFPTAAFPRGCGGLISHYKFQQEAQ